MIFLVHYLHHHLNRGIQRNLSFDYQHLNLYYNQKISTLTNQNILLEAKLQTIAQDHLDAQKELLAEKLELQEKYDNLLADIEEDGETSN